MFEFHPRPNDQGQPVWIQTPRQATAIETWSDPSAMAICRPNGLPSMILNGEGRCRCGRGRAGRSRLGCASDQQLWRLSGDLPQGNAGAGRDAPGDRRARGLRGIWAGGGGVRLPRRLEALGELHALLPRAPSGRLASRYGLGISGGLAGAARSADGNPQPAGRSRDRGGASGTGGRIGDVVWGARE